MAYAGLVGIEFVYAFASLVLVSLGLAVIFGMMRIINLAHGEFIVLGSYAAIFAGRAGLSTWIACLVVAPLAVAVIGLVLERLIMRHLYGRIVETMLATWGLSLFITGLLSALFGTSTAGISVPVGPVPIGPYTTSGYNLGDHRCDRRRSWRSLRAPPLHPLRTACPRHDAECRDGRGARGQHLCRLFDDLCARRGAGRIGRRPTAPVTGVFPTIGGAYIGKAFITVISGGSAIIAGTVSASAMLAVVNQVATFATNQVFGEVALLVAALILIRFLPERHHQPLFPEEPVSNYATPIGATAPIRFTLGQYGLIAVGVVGLCLLIGLPMVLDLFTLLQLTVYVIFAILALSLGFVLGFGGILCLGQSAFFGIGAYTYAIAAFNMGGTTIPLLLALLAPAIFALILGYFIFYGRITEVYVGVITITVTLILFQLVNSTSGAEYRIGNAELGGYNGIPAVPLLEWPFQPGNLIGPADMFRLCLGALARLLFRSALAAGVSAGAASSSRSARMSGGPSSSATTSGSSSF